jgi:hypothetical protein
VPFTACLTNTQQKLQRHNPTTEQSPAAGPLQKQSNNHPTPIKACTAVARCSRPLSTCQTPHPPTPTQPLDDQTGTGGTEQSDPPPPIRRGFTGLIPQGPTACQNPGPQGSITPRTTTQVPHHRTRASSSTTAVLRTATRGTRAFVDDSTSEHHQCQPHGVVTARGACSLERR